MAERNRQQNKVLSVRMLPEAYMKLSDEANAAGISISALAKTRLFGSAAIAMKCIPKPSADTKILSQLLAGLGKTGGNINQIAKKLNQGNRNLDHALIDRMHKDIKIMREALLDALGVTWDKR